MDIKTEDLEVRLKFLLSKCKNKDNVSEVQKSKLSISEAKVKLPDIPLPQFCGKYEDWTSFKSQFNILIASNESLNDLQKLHYLQAALKGEAKLIQTADDTFQSLFNELEQRYENKRFISDAHINAILNLEKITHESGKDLHKLIDTVLKHLRGLKLLQLQMNKLSELVLINIILAKLDKESRKVYEMSLKTNDLPNWDEFIQFLQTRSQVLENVQRISVASKPKLEFTPKHKNLMLRSNTKPNCKICGNSPHPVYRCKMFLELPVEERINEVKKKFLCFNCLEANHKLLFCPFREKKCRVCESNHHTLIHKENTNKAEKRVSVSEAPIISSETRGEQTLANCLLQNNTRRHVFLSTAIVYIKNSSGCLIPIRCVLDSASTLCFATCHIADLLGIKKEKTNLPIGGLNGSIATVKNKICTSISDARGEFKRNVEFFLVQKVTDLTPSKPLDLMKINFPKHLMYADPNFNKPGTIDALLGAEIFYELLGSGKIKLENEAIILQETVFGWIVTGALNDVSTSLEKAYCHIAQENVEISLKNFWNLESLGIQDDPRSDLEDEALKIFNETVTFKDGRYEVSLPWKRDWKEMRDNYGVAERRFKSLAKRLQRNPTFHQNYNEIIDDYLNQGIIERVCESEKPTNKPVFYLPHQAVIRSESITTKIRIVFDASSHEDGQLALNDCVWTGVNLNPNIFNLLTYFRLNKVAILSDIQQAFLQISLAERDRDAVRFIFAADKLIDVENLKTVEYRFTRVIFGVNASPFLLAATIKEHIRRVRDTYTETASILDNCFYVDDLIYGMSDVDDAFRTSCESEAIMKGAGMLLRKWTSNNPDLIKKWEENGFNIHPIHSSDSSENSVKVLGISWDPKSDFLTMNVDKLLELLNEKKSTKRFLLQIAGKIYDPLGFISPYTVRFKMLFQEIWLRKISWDEELPSDIKDTWVRWYSELPYLSELQIPRVVLPNFDDVCEVEIHSFCDASQRAYGACVYLKVKSESGVFVNLVASKTRVAPLSKMTLPRLELLGALLSARLATEVKKCVDRKTTSTSYFWTDSQVTLHWIRGTHSRWKLFVSNRVKEIQSLTDKDSWHHCAGKDNPADLASRGEHRVKSLINNTIWWSGPPFLHNEDVESSILRNNELLPELTEQECHNELRKSYFLNDSNCLSISANTLSSQTPINHSVHQNPVFDRILLSSNNYYTIIRVVSYLFRFLYNCQNPKSKKMGQLTLDETKVSEVWILRATQQSEFKEEIKMLNKGKPVPPKSKLSSLNIFLDENKLIRVGGRLRNSNLPIQAKFPIVLPAKHSLTILILTSYHLKYLHLGPQSLLYQVRQKFWPLNGRSSCRKIVHNCIICFKNKPTTSNQIMGDLPSERVIPTFPFDAIGIDYCGPFSIKFKNQRKGILNKIYVVVYVCLVTKAIHLDFVTDLTTPAFIASLKLFFAGRGKCSKIMTDNAKTFIGANVEIKKLVKLVNSPDEELSKFFTSEGIEWKFIPPKSPNFGGIWEAGVKSFKFHLKRVIGNQNLTLEEFVTILAEIEGVLNSRPLTPLSSEFDEFQTLTPAHFLVGRPISSLAEPHLVNLNENRLSKWQKITKFTQKIWKLWKRDYLNNLQQRYKWKFEKDDIKEGTLVVIKQENLPSTQWLIGRVIDVYLGADKKVRVVNLRLPGGKTLKRNVRDICILPVE